MSINDADLNSLEQQVAALTKQIEQALDEKTAMRGFLAHIAHELRTPLNTIIGFSQILERHTKVSEEQQEYLSLILLSSDHLLSLINDILQISKLESGEISLELGEIDLLKFVEVIESIFGAEAKEKHLQFEVQVAEDLPRFIMGDESKIRQILSNLLSNAIKFTDSGRVGLSIFPECTNDKDGHIQIVFAVSDTGQGIQDDEIDQVFKPYQQTKSGKASMKGTGLGLAITRELVELMNGYMQVESEWGCGTTFTASIQAKSVYNQTNQRDETPNIINLDLGSNNYRVLIVDDNKNNRDLLQNLLSKVGFQVELAEDGLQAVEIFQSWTPDLILMDMRMPVMNGVEATEQIHALFPDNQVVIIALTADAILPNNDIRLPGGCDDYIAKPFHISNLLEKIGKHLHLNVLYNTPSDPASDVHTNTIEHELVILSPELKHQLSDVVSSYSIEQVHSIIDKLPPNLARFTTERLEEFDFEAIISMIDR